MIPRSQRSFEFSDQDDLLRRHRSPESPHQREIERILADSAIQARHAVPIDEENEDDPKLTLDKISPNKCLHGFTDVAKSYQQGWEQYSLPKFRDDVVAGIVVSILVVPMSMSYAKIAGLPAYYGLYTAFVPAIVYPLFGTSRHLCTGPAALVSLILSTGLTTIVADEGLSSPNDPAYIKRYTQLAIQCSVLVGIIYIAMGVFRLGFVTQFLSRALISGFNSGAAVFILVEQIKYLFGYEVQPSNRIYDILIDIIREIDQWSWKPFVMGMLSIFALLALNMFFAKKPKFMWCQPFAPFLVSIVAIILTVALGLDDKGIQVVGTIPKGLPQVSINQWKPLSMDLWTTAISAVVVGFVQSFALAKRFSYKHGYEIAANQELVAFGICNIAGGMFSSYPSSACLGQSAALDFSGAKTGVASVVQAVVVMFVLLFLTPVFEKLPLAVLAGIVISYVVKMFDYKEAMYLYKVHKFDFSVWIASLIGTVFLGVQIGLGIAVGLSLLIVVYEAVYPNTAVLGRLPGTSLYRDVKQYPEVELYDGVLIVAIQTPLFFANAQSVRDKLRKYKRAASRELAARNAGDVRYIILELAPVTHVDTTALHVLEDMYVTQQEVGTKMCFCTPTMGVMDKLVKSGIADLVGRERFFSAVIDAVRWCLNDMDKLSGGRSLNDVELGQDNQSVDSDDPDAALTCISVVTGELKESTSVVNESSSTSETFDE